MPAAGAGDPGTFDVAIAGAGLAGASLALRLARAGARVALLDAGRFPRDKVCGEFLSPECWGAFDDLGLSGAVEGLGYHPIRRVRISTPRGTEVVATVVDPAGRPGIGLSRSALDDLLLGRARAAGAEVFEGHRVAGPLVEGGRVVGLAARGAAGPREVRARVTVAADGRRSALVKQTGATRDRSWLRPRLFGLKRHLRPDDAGLAEQPETVGLHLVPGGYGGTCRVEGGATNLCALLPEATVRARRGDLDRVAAECLGRNPALGRLLAGAGAADPWQAIAGVRVQVARPRLPGILYAGDARGTVDPLGGQGMTMALLGAAELAPLVGAALVRGGAGADAALQARWARAWERRFRRRIHLCRAFHHFLVRPGLADATAPLGPLGAWLLAAGFGLTREARPRIAARRRPPGCDGPGRPTILDRPSSPRPSGTPAGTARAASPSSNASDGPP